MNKNTPLLSVHKDLKAKIIGFAGFDMPITYSSIKDEHQAVRHRAGLFDVSHMGEFLVKGPSSLDLLQYICSNDTAKLADGCVQYACFPNKNGGIVDDLLVYRLKKDEYMLVVNASNIEKDFKWIAENNKFGAELTNVSDDFALLALQGPKASEILSPLCKENPSDLKYYTFFNTEVAGIPDILVSATGYTGSGGYELYVKPENAVHLWQKLMESGEKFGLQPAGLAARDSLRLEMGYCLYGNDIDDETSPLEAGLSWITKFNKDFIGKDILEKQKANGLTKKLVGFELLDRGIPRKDYPIVDGEGKEIGRVTSGTQSPSLDKAIGLGYVPLDYAKRGSKFFVQIRKKTIEAKVVKVPFK